ncbi:hypothetical protein ABDK09_12200 [Vibrio sp. CDRSL-10 TSBA]
MSFQLKALELLGAKEHLRDYFGLDYLFEGELEALVDHDDRNTAIT